MARILALDIGTKRTGIAETDPMQIIAEGVTTVRSHQLIDFLKEYMSREEVECVVVGLPLQMDHTESQSEPFIRGILKKIEKEFPDLRIHREDERFTSKMAQQAMITGGMKKSRRREKGVVDEISAVLILQSYMNRRDRGGFPA